MNSTANWPGSEPMTFVKTRFHLEKELTPKDLGNLHQLSTHYGIRGLCIEASDLVVDYDGSRMHEAEVLAAVRSVGIAASGVQPLPLGGFDYTGEFKDFAWPMTGLSPVNQKQK
jgi:hypothetical protein